jgi:hypothetical protein
MKKNFRLALLIILLGVIFLSLPKVVYGDANPMISISNGDDKENKEIDKMMEAFKQDMKKEGFWSADDDPLFLSKESYADKVYTIKIDMSYYNDLGSEKAKQTIMKSALENINDSGISRVNKVKIYNYVCDQDKSTSSFVRQLSDDVNADFGEAYMMFKPFSGVIGIILGVLTLGTFIALALHITLDICYITIPGIQLALYNEKTNKAKFISIEAQKAVEFAANSEGTNYVNPLSFYFKHKTKQFIAIGICILYLVSGQIYTLIANIIDAFKGIIG